MKFKIDQLALHIPGAGPDSPRERALEFLRRCGIDGWTEDRVRAEGVVYGRPASNAATLLFNYEAFAGKELEVIRYDDGDNWLDQRSPWSETSHRRLRHAEVSHIGMHCTEEELLGWRALMSEFGIRVAQEVQTTLHTNPRIANCRRYNYVIFDTHPLIGVDMKFIVRSIIDEQEEARQAGTS